MEQRAKQVGKGGELYYINPANGDYFTKNLTEGARAEALGMADHLLEDFHVTVKIALLSRFVALSVSLTWKASPLQGGVSTGAEWSKSAHTGGAVDGSRQLFANQSSWNEGSCNLETNAGTHDMSRALMEGADLNDFFGHGFIPAASGEPSGRIKARTASFCTERSGWNEGGANDQGLAFYLPNGTWLQPPGMVHKMFSQDWLPGALAVSRSGGAAALSVSAQLAADRSQLRLLVVNNRSTAAKTTVTIQGWQPAGTALVTTLQAPSLDAANPPFSTRISPSSGAQPWAADGACDFPPLSVSVVLLNASSAARMKTDEDG